MHSNISESAYEAAEDSGAYARVFDYCEKIVEVDPEDQDAKNKLESLEIFIRQKEEELTAIAGGMHGEPGTILESFADFNGDGEGDEFVSICSTPLAGVRNTDRWTAYYVDSSGDCQQVTELPCQYEDGFNLVGMQFERDGTSYSVHAISDTLFLL